MTRIRPAGWLALAGALFLVAVAGYGWLVSAFPHYWLQTEVVPARGDPRAAAAGCINRAPERLTPFGAGPGQAGPAPGGAWPGNQDP